MRLQFNFALLVLLAVLSSCKSTPIKNIGTVRTPANTLGEIRPGFVAIKDLVATKKTVCAMTLNSEEEILTFQKNLPASEFQFVELVDQESGWLQNAIQSKIKCDILVVSGHFGGSFFGDNGSLTLTELEEATCSKEGTGIFHSVKEVFLFGCNTLAGKTQDHRTPEEYIQVLLADNFSRVQAEQIAAFRYSPIGNTFSDRMTKVFSGVPRIYGFTSVGPSGKTVEPLLNRYFARKKNYSNYLDQMNSSQNQELLSALKYSAINQVAGVPNQNSEVIPRCILSDKKAPESVKLKLVDKLLTDPNQRLGHVQEIGEYLLRNRRSGASRNLEIRLSRKWYEDKGLRNDMNKILDQGIKNYPLLRIQSLDVGIYFGWLSISDARRIEEETIGTLFKDGLTIEESDMLISLGEITSEVIRYEWIEPLLPFNRGLLDVITRLEPQDPKIHWAIVETMKSDKNEFIRGAAVAALGAIKPQDPKIHWAIVETMKSDKNEFIREAAAQTIGKIESQDPKIHLAIVEAMRTDSSESVRIKAARALASINPQGPKIHLAIVETMKTDSSGSVRMTAAEVLGAIKPQDPKIHLAIVETMKSDKNEFIRGTAAAALGAIKPQDPKIHLAIIDVMKNDSLESVRIEAAWALEIMNPQDPKIHLAFMEVMKTDNSEVVRSYAASALGKINPQDPKIRLAIIDVMRTDSSESVRIKAARALASINPQDPKIHLAIVEATRTDSSQFVRTEAVRALGIINPQDPKIHLAIMEVMKTDSSEVVRFYAALALGKIKPQDPKIRLAIIDVIKNDSSERVQSVAAEALKAIDVENSN